MKTDSFASRHIGISEEDIQVMLRKIGVATLDELIDKTIPANIRLKEPLALPPAMTEYEFSNHIAQLASKNKLYTSEWDGTIPLPLPLFKETCLRTRCGILLTLLIKPKFHKGVLKPL